MSQLDHLAARSVARERERDLQVTLRQRETRRGPDPGSSQPEPESHWLRDMLVHLHLVHAPSR
ncbi:hypothetical protein [Ornithinimicrobium flavum]|uniref:hypothetical protein n=1 Tax=Ornithinimicrobium flavum TaxID=1288636 RepID=UPI00106F5221|nr:hypothetical protein [Ornithinimicrobium flavum]